MAEPDRMHDFVVTWIKTRLDEHPELSQAELAQIAGTDPGNFSRMLTGKSSYSRGDYLQPIAARFGVETKDIYRDALTLWEQDRTKAAASPSNPSDH